MKKIFYTLTATLALMTSCQDASQEMLAGADGGVRVSFGMNFEVGDEVLTRAGSTSEYYIAITSEAIEGEEISSGYVGRFSSLTEASVSLPANVSYTFCISAFKTNDYSIDWSSTPCSTSGKFFEVTSPVAYAPAFAGEKVDRYYGSTTQTLTGNTAISVHGTRYAYGIKVSIEAPTEGHVVVSSESPAFSYTVRSTDDAVTESSIYCMAGTNPQATTTSVVKVQLYDALDKLAITLTKELTIARNHMKNVKVNALDPKVSFDFDEDDDDMEDDPVDEITNNTYRGHEYVDLGITDEQGRPIYWAKCNIGAGSPENFGLYFAWGDTEGHSSNGINGTQPDGYSYDWAHAPFNNGSSTFNNSYFRTIEDVVSPGGVLAPEYDAAHVKWGGDWRMPTKEEQDALRARCLWTWNEDKHGFTVTGSNGNSIFLPAVGNRYESALVGAGSNGPYLSSSIDDRTSGRAYVLLFFSNGTVYYTSVDFCYGYTVRPVFCPAE